jgi:hypothetical protein
MTGVWDGVKYLKFKYIKMYEDTQKMFLQMTELRV